MNISAVIAIIAGFITVLCTQGSSSFAIKMLFQPEAFFIVIGGTFCATILNYSPVILSQAFHSLKDVFIKRVNRAEKQINELIQLAYQARRDGIFSIYEESKSIESPFLRRAIQLAVDVDNSQLLYDVMEAEIMYEEEQEIISSRVFEAMGGYAPTFGIVGAVLGLIRIMGDLQSLETIGIGIATAFVSTLYGVGLANMVLLPIAGNLKAKTREKVLLKEVILQGVIAIHMNENPAILQEKLLAYLKYNNHPQKTQKIGIFR